METRSSFISGPCIQQLFESCSNAGSKAAAQFFTPIDWAEVLSIPLPRYRPVVIDLNCGSGNLLLGASRASTNHRLGCDIDPCESAARPEVVQAYSGQVNGVQRITGDVCKLLPLLKAVDWRSSSSNAPTCKTPGGGVSLRCNQRVFRGPGQ